MSPTRRWVVIGAVVAVLVLVVGWLLVVKPEQSKVSTINEQTTEQNSSNALLLTQISALQAEQKELPQQQLALQKFSTEVPDSTAEPTLVRQLTTAAQRSDVELVTISPGTPVPLTGAASATTLGAAPTAAGTLYQLPVSLGIIGSYANVESFFNAIEHLARATIITGFTICPETSSGVGNACQGPAEPSNKVAPPGSVGVSVTAAVFYTPPAALTAPTTTDQTLTAPATTPTTAATTPATGAPDVTGPSTTGAAAGATS
jgi:Tfp pilus assembly protein PilO